MAASFISQREKGKRDAKATLTLPSVNVRYTSGNGKYKSSY